MKETKNSGYKRTKILDTKGKVISAIAAGVLFMLIVAALMYMESGYGKLIIKNNSNLNLEYVKSKFVYGDGDLNSENNSDKLNAHDVYTKELEPINLLGFSANYEIHFKFENYDEFIVDAGVFDDKFKGNIKIEFKKTNDPNLIKIKIKASNGLLPSKLIDCNEIYTINLSEGTVLE